MNFQHYISNISIEKFMISNFHNFLFENFSTILIVILLKINVVSFFNINCLNYRNSYSIFLKIIIMLKIIIPFI